MNSHVTYRLLICQFFVYKIVYPQLEITMESIFNEIIHSCSPVGLITGYHKKYWLTIDFWFTLHFSHFITPLGRGVRTLLSMWSVFLQNWSVTTLVSLIRGLALPQGDVSSQVDSKGMRNSLPNEYHDKRDRLLLLSGRLHLPCICRNRIQGAQHLNQRTQRLPLLWRRICCVPRFLSGAPMGVSTTGVV